MQSVRYLEFILEKSFHLEQLAQVSLTLHQGKVLFDVIEYVRNTPGVQIAEIQIEWEAPCPVLILNHIPILLQTAHIARCVEDVPVANSGGVSDSGLL